MYVAFDLLYRLLRSAGYDVTYVRNFTDVDDKIIARAAAAGEDPLALSRRFIDEFHADMVRARGEREQGCAGREGRNGGLGRVRQSRAQPPCRTNHSPINPHARAPPQDALRCLPPALEPRATDYVPQMVAMIERIIAHGHAYTVEGGESSWPSMPRLRRCTACPALPSQPPTTTTLPPPPPASPLFGQAGDVYFDVESLPGYGKLSGRQQVRGSESLFGGAHEPA